MDRSGMERTVTLIVLLTISIIAAALIIMYIAGMKDELLGGMCDPDPYCASRVNGETFCPDGTTLVRCVLKDGCLRSMPQECACVVDDGVASCA